MWKVLSIYPSYLYIYWPTSWCKMLISNINLKSATKSCTYLGMNLNYNLLFSKTFEKLVLPVNSLGDIWSIWVQTPKRLQKLITPTLIIILITGKRIVNKIMFTINKITTLIYWLEQDSLVIHPNKLLSTTIMKPIKVRYINKQMNPNTLLKWNLFKHAATNRIATQAIWAAVLYTRLSEWITIGPPPSDAGRRVLTIHGSPRHNKMSSVLAPKALLMLMEPIPKNNTKTKQYII